MPKKVSYKEVKSDFFKAPAGWHPAIIVWLMELWTESRDFQGDWKFKDCEEIRVLFEIEAEVEIYDSEKEELTWKFEDKIWIIWINYADIISDKSKLWKVINAVCDVKSVKEIKNFSLDELLWKKCFIEVEMKWKEKNYDTIVWVSGFSKKVNYHEQKKESFYFWMEDPNDFDNDLVADKAILKPWDKERIEKSKEYKAVCAKFWIELPETLKEQEENMKVEAEERKEEAKKAEAEPTVSESESESEVSNIFAGEEPAPVQVARDNAKEEEKKTVKPSNDDKEWE